jgi:phosphatidyl-myo-inositol dimannoside synthase
VSPEDRAAARSRLAEQLGVSDDAFLVLTLGRLVRRKGARWFTAEVLPKLPGEVHYVVAGDGAEAEPVRAAAAAAGVSGRVHLLGSGDDETRETAMRGADLFVQPNIRVPGDMEGFGLVTIEAALRGTPVVAAALEGILDAVVDGETGILLSSEDPDAWVRCVTDLVSDRGSLPATGQQYRKAASARYGETAMQAELVRLLTTAAEQR